MNEPDKPYREPIGHRFPSDPPLTTEEINADLASRDPRWLESQEGTCDGCGKKRDRVIRRLPGVVRLCDPCHNGEAV